MSSFTLQEYRIQRQYRQGKRKEYLKRFQLLKQKIPLSTLATHSISRAQPVHEKTSKSSHKKGIHENRKQQSIQQSQEHNHSHHSRHTHSKPESQQQLFKQVEQNKILKEELELIESQQRKKLTQFKQQISTIKEKYIGQIKSISSQSQKNKSQTDQKTKKIMDQMQNGIKKNSEIKKVNEQMKTQLSESDATMGSYATEIKNQYAKKLNQFQKIFNSSNQKIQEMEKQFNEEQFVNNALANQDLLKTIQQNASKSQQAVKILDDYKQLLAGKTQILKEINSNIQMKETQLSKMSQLQGKMKIIFQKMNAEKKSYVTENQKMTKQLIEVKQLIMGFVSQAEGENGAQQGQ